LLFLWFFHRANINGPLGKLNHQARFSRAGHRTENHIDIRQWNAAAGLKAIQELPVIPFEIVGFHLVCSIAEKWY